LLIIGQSQMLKRAGRGCSSLIGSVALAPAAAIGLLSSKIAHSKNFSNPHFLLQNLLVCYLVSSEWTLTLSNSLYSLHSAWSKSGY
jgi:hypothetical protein